MSLAAEAVAGIRRALRGAHQRQNHPVAFHLTQFAAGVLVPVLLIVAFMLINTARLWRDEALHNARLIVQHLDATIEVELEKAINVSQTLASALALDGPDHARVDAQVRDAARLLGENVVLFDGDRRQVINAAVPAGDPLPALNESSIALNRLAAARRGPVVSDLELATVRRTPIVSAITPVLEGTEITRFISVSISPERLSAILADGLPAGWIAGVVGQDGRVIARSSDLGRHIGQVNPQFTAAVTSSQGIWNGATRDGIPVAGAYVRSPLSGWVVSVGVPEAILHEPALQAVAWLGVLTVAALLLSLVFGWRLSRRISLPIHELADQARQLGARQPGEGRALPESRSGLSEVNAVTAALRNATLELDRRARAERLAAEAGRANEERLQLVQETAGIGTIDWNLEAGHAVWSHQFQEMFSLPAADLGGSKLKAQDLLERIHPGERERIEHLWEGLSGQDRPFQDDFRILTPEGDERWVHARGRLDLKNEKPTRLLGAMIDITASKRNEQALLASEARFRGIFENAAVGVALIGPDGAYLLVNQRICDIVGYTSEEMLTKTIKDITDPADFDDNLPRWQQIRDGEIASFATEKRYVRKDGATVWCAVTVSPRSAQSDGSGRSDAPDHFIAPDGFIAPDYFIAIVRDVTNRRRAEAQLQERLREIEALYDNAPVGLTVIDPNRRFVRVNQALAEMLRLSADETPGRFAWDVAPALRDALDPRIAEVLTSGRTVETELSAETPGAPGVTRQWLAKIYPIRHQDDSVIAVGIVMEEITERKQSEQHLRFLLREISHRSKNLLAVIQAMAGQTAKSAETVDAFKRRFGERLMGLAASHDLLVNQDWLGASVESLVRGQLAPFVERDDPRVQIRGPSVDLKSEATEALGLALHELATNSLKYGALSDPDGQVEIVWGVYGSIDPFHITDRTGAGGHDTRPGDADTVAAGRRFRMEWIEHTVAPVSPPGHKGFGRIVIEHTVEASLGGKVTLQFPPEGLRWRIDAPVSCLAATGQTVAA
jgi:PAS domain S-box-containing protein